MARHFYSSQAQQCQLASACTSTATTLLVPTATYVGYPGSYPYTIRLEPGTANEELVDVTAAPVVSGANYQLTVARAQDGSTGRAHAAGSVVDHGVVARDFTEAGAHIYATAGIHGVRAAARLLGLEDTTARSLYVSTASGVPDASGYLWIPHGMSVTPLAVIVQPVSPSGGSPIFSGAICDTITSDQFRIRCIATTGGAVVSPTVVNLTFIAIG